MKTCRPNFKIFDCKKKIHKLEYDKMITQILLGVNLFYQYV